MRVLVSGAGGFLGRQVVGRLLECGHSVRAIVRPASPKPTWREDVQLFRADLRVHDDLVSAFIDIDAVLHLAAGTSGNEDIQFAASVVASERFLEAMAKSSVKRLIHVSSMAVYDWARAGPVMDENTPLLLRDVYDMGAYTIAKVWQERVIMKFALLHSWDLTIMRPGFIWGPQHAEIAGMGRQFGRAHFMFGPLTRLPLTHVVNCADCLVTAAENPAAIGEIFNVIDDDEIRVWRYVREYTRRTSRGGKLVPIPYRVGLGTAQLAALTSRALFGNRGKLPSLLTPRKFESQFKPLRFSNKKVREVLAWAAPSRFDQCLRLTYGSRTKRLEINELENTMSGRE
jgi:UDP-glucose 4-epimerase